MRTVDTDVLVVGAGPTGLTAAMLLADYGIKAITINQYPGTAHTPRAHITNIRTVEMFRDMGIETEIANVSDPLSFLCNNVVAESLAGLEVARYMSYGSGADRLSDYAQASPCKPLNCPQHVMEPVLLEAAKRRGADVRFSHKLIEIRQSNDEVCALVKERATDCEYLIRAKYLIGADGGRSAVAEQLGVRFEGEAALRNMVNVWMDVDLSRYTSYRPSVIYSILRRQQEKWATHGAFVCVRPWSNWTYSTPGTVDIPEEELLGRIRQAIGDPDIKITVRNISGWQVHHLFATTYKVGRTFLAGDAAHRHPPSGGLGTNTSVQDAYNLVWKLALAVHGKAGEALLESYHEERMPIGKFVVQRAIKSLYNQDAVASALGSLPAERIFADSPIALQCRESLAQAVKAQDYRSNALGVELGQRYKSSAVISDGDFPEFAKDPELYYQPTSCPGAFLPHAWVEHKQRRISTLDIVGHRRFALIVGLGGERWIAAAVRISKEFSLELPTYVIGYRCEYDDVYGNWTSIREMGEAGALLVRPDRYIAWRSPELPANPEESLRRVMKQVLAR